MRRERSARRTFDGSSTASEQKLILKMGDEAQAALGKMIELIRRPPSEANKKEILDAARKSFAGKTLRRNSV